LLVNCALGLSAALASASPVRAEAETASGTVILRMRGEALAQRAGGLGAVLIEEYGSFRLFEVPAAVAERLQGLPGVEVEDAATRILLHAGTIDTRSPEAVSRRQASIAPGGRRLHLVQFRGPVKPEWVAALEGTGVEIVTAVPNHAYLVYGDMGALIKVRPLVGGTARLRWEGEYRATDKIHPRALAVTKEGLPEVPGEEYAIQMVWDPENNAKTLALLDGLKRAPFRRQKRVHNYLNVIASVPQSSLLNVASQPDVVSIHPYVTPRKFDERQDQIVAGNLVGTHPAAPGYLAWLLSKGFTQAQFDSSGLVVDVTDSGIDNGTNRPNHFGLYRTGDTGQASRVVYNRLEGSPNPGSTLQGCDGHGNLNAHIIGGYNDRTGFPHEDAAGYNYGLGVCPFVKVGSSVIFDTDFFTSPDYSDLISRAYRDGARISSDSWGADTFGGYDLDAQEYDFLVRDGQPAGAAVSSNGNQQMTIVFAAGNAGPTAGSVGSPGTAKNIITVGAAENVHSHATTNGGNSATGLDGCSTPDAEANSADDIASFSSRGPCDDGRRKPEIVAPGTHITGGVAQQNRVVTGTGDDIACFEGTGVCALPGGGTVGSASNFFPLGQQFYSTSSGTSHSTPAAAGAVALLHQYFLNQAWGIPSPAMLKAYLINSARYMTGVDANDDLWSNDQGMGGVQLAMAFDGVPRILRDQVTEDTFTASGQSRLFLASAVDTSKPVRVTMSWTDAPGTTSASAYKNNLDLTVTVGGNTYRGNVFSGAFSTTGGSADPRNNSESVFLPAGTSGSLLITVTAVDINSDGVPNVAPALDQDFALAIYNAEVVNAPVIVVEQVTVTADDCGIGNGILDPSENVTVAIELKNAGTANTTNLTATLLESGGVTNASGPQVYGALSTNGTPVSQSYNFTVDRECGETLTASLQLQDGAADLGTVTVQLPVGDLTGTSVTNANSAAITIPASSTVGAASPYPSAITVAGLNGNVTKVIVSIPSFSHTYPDDLDVLLVGPGGQKVMLLSDAGGGGDVNNIGLTFDDEAAATVADAGPLAGGTYKPTNIGSPDAMTSPAPGEPYDAALSAFTGTDPNGTWSLYVVDDASQDAGVMASGWTLTIEAGEPVCCATNVPPVLEPIGARQVTISNLLQFAVTGHDFYDGDVVSLSASNLPAWATFATVSNAVAVTNLFSGTPEATGTFSVTFYAADKDGIDAETVAITVTPVPVFNCDVFFSEYVEGSSNNKAVEIFNGTPAAIDLDAADYYVQGYHNGNVTAFYNIGLTGVVASGDAFVLVNSGAGSGLLALGDQAAAANQLSFNGDDALVLRSGGTNGAILDSIGQVGADPGNSWGTGSDTTLDHTLRRMETVTAGDTNPTNAFDPALEWSFFPVDTFDGLGSHVSSCGGESGTPPTLAPIGDKVVLLSNDLVFSVSAIPTESNLVSLSASNLPAGATFESVAENGTFAWSNAAPIGVYTSTFYAADEDGIDSEMVTITVIPPAVPPGEPLVWVNEFHYDNTPLDNNEGVELAGPAGLDLSLYAVVAYNGADGRVYATRPVAGTIDDEGCGYGAIWVEGPGIQDGAPDGFAVVDGSSNVLQFLSYEGSFVAVDGPAAGLTSVDVGVSEEPAPAAGVALQLIGSGTNYSQFSWSGPSAHSRGDLNPGQSIAPCVDGDQDDDGIPDAVETAWCGGATNCTPEEPTGDGDIYGYLDEYLLDYDPAVSNQPFEVESIAVQSPVTLQFEATNSRVYTLEFSTNLVEVQPWQVLESALPGSNGVMSVIDTNEADQRGYRLQVHVP